MTTERELERASERASEGEGESESRDALLFTLGLKRSSLKKLREASFDSRSLIGSELVN